MALLKGDCHAVIITGNLLKTNTLSLKLPFEDISTNLWQISISQIAQSYNKSGKQLCGISCNFVKDIKYNSNNQIISCFPILWQIILSGNVADKKVYNFEKSWFYITSTQQELILQFHPYVNGKITDNVVNLDCDVFVTLYIQRVK